MQIVGLKKYLTSSMGDLCTNNNFVHNMLELQHTEIYTSFQTSMIKLEHRFEGKMMWPKFVRNI